MKALIFGLLTLLLVGCNTTTAPETKPKAEQAQESKELVIYSGRGQVLIQKLVDDFQAKTGIKVSVRYDKSTQALASRLMSEQNQTQADVFIAQDSGYL